MLLSTHLTCLIHIGRYTGCAQKRTHRLESMTNKEREGRAKHTKKKRKCHHNPQTMEVKTYNNSNEKKGETRVPQTHAEWACDEYNRRDGKKKCCCFSETERNEGEPRSSAKRSPTLLAASVFAVLRYPCACGVARVSEEKEWGQGIV